MAFRAATGRSRSPREETCSTVRIVDSRRLVFDVFGRRMTVVETPDGWKAFYPGQDGKRRPADVAIPSHLEEEEIASYLDDLFHEHASADHPKVRML